MALFKKVKNLFFSTVIISVITTTIPSLVLSADASTLPAKIDSIVFIPFQKMLTQIQQSFVNQSMPFQDTLPAYQLQTADGSVQVVSERVDISASVNSKSLAAIDNQNLSLGLQLNSAVIAAQNVNIGVTIRKDLGFGVATLHLDVKCQQIKINLQNQNPISAGVDFQQGIANVSEIAWDLSNTAVNTELLGCNEVAGFDAELKNQVKAFIQQSVALDSLKTLINAKINPIIKDKINSELTTLLVKYNLDPQNKHSFDAKNNFWVYTSEAAENGFLINEVAALSQVAIPSMLIKKSSVENLVKTNINDYLAKNTISSKIYTALEKLTCSRFSQFFVWPALRSLSKCFDMKVQNRVETVQIKNLSTLQMNLKLSSWASGEGRNLAYFSSEISALPTAPQASVLSLAGQQDPTFTNWSGKSSRISTSAFKASLQTMLNTMMVDLSKQNTFSFFKKNTSVKQVGVDALLLGLN